MAPTPIKLFILAHQSIYLICLILTSSSDIRSAFIVSSLFILCFRDCNYLFFLSCRCWVGISKRHLWFPFRNIATFFSLLSLSVLNIDEIDCSLDFSFWWHQSLEWVDLISFGNVHKVHSQPKATFLAWLTVYIFIRTVRSRPK